jgi:uncharacterized membrane protein YadS
MFWATDGMFIAHILLSMFVGCSVALLAKRREMVATITLSLILGAMAAIGTVVMLTRIGPAYLSMLPWHFADWLAIVVGGAIVRMRRSAATTRPSTAQSGQLPFG